MSADKGPPAQPGTMDDGLNAVKEGWFTELSTMWPGQGLSLEVKEVLFRQRSKFQVPLKGAPPAYHVAFKDKGCFAKDDIRVHLLARDSAISP